jgi:hypothetical protein
MSNNMHQLNDTPSLKTFRQTFSYQLRISKGTDRKSIWKHAQCNGDSINKTQKHKYFRQVDDCLCTKLEQSQSVYNVLNIKRDLLWGISVIIKSRHVHNTWTSEVTAPKRKSMMQCCGHSYFLDLQTDCLGFSLRSLYNRPSACA